MSGVTHVIKRAHHIQTGKCLTRAKYRQGREDTSVKVFTVSQESYFLLIQNVPSLGVQAELQALCQKFGTVEVCEQVPDYPSPEFTQVFLIKYARLQEARTAKKGLDERSFFGAVLNVCYAPELETLPMTMKKLKERQSMVSARLFYLENPGATRKQTKDNRKGASNSRNMVSAPASRIDQAETSVNDSAGTSQPATITYIWAGEEYTVPAVPKEPPERSALKPSRSRPPSSLYFKPRQLAGTKTPSTCSQLPAGSLSYEETRKRIRDKLDAVRSSNPEVSIVKKMKKSS